jgi:hypothetical protein
MFTITVTETITQRSITEAVERVPETIEVVRYNVPEIDLVSLAEVIHKKPRAKRSDAGRKRGERVLDPNIIHS